MMSLSKFYHADRETQQAEIDRTCYILELLYDRYKSTGVILLRGQYWKIEKYLMLYLYLQAQKDDGVKLF